MNKIFLPLILFCPVAGYAQCPTNIPLTVQPDNCLGTTLTVGSTPGFDYNKITWYDGSNSVSVVNATPGSSSGVTVAGGNGSGPAANQIYPAGLYVDAAGNIYVVDVDNSRVQKWTPGATSGVTVAGGNGAGNAPNQLNYPIGLAVDAAGYLYIADASNDRVQKWVPGASSGITVAGGNGQGNAANQLFDPSRVAIDPNNGDLYIGDSQNNRVQKWPAGATSGVTVAGGNGSGPAANQLSGVYGLALDNAGNIYISDNGNNRVQEWTPGSTSGTTIIGGTGFGSAPNQLGGPAGIFIDNAGNLYIGDYFNERVMEYAPGASSGVLVAGGNGQGNGANQFFEPECSFVDNNGNLYVSDAFNYRVQKWNVSSINRSYTPVTPGSYSAEVQINSGCTVTIGPLIVNPMVTPSIVISTPVTQINPCAPVSFSAAIVAGGINPSYQWQINGKNAGTNNPVFASDQITDGDIVSCILTSNTLCAPVKIVNSNSLTMSLSTGSRPAVRINMASANICSGTPIQFHAELMNGAMASSYQWKVNGENIGMNSADFDDLLTNDGDTISCEVLLNNGCITSASDSIIVTVRTIPAIAVGQTFVSSPGQGIVLNPIVSGNIQSYAWSPGYSLSDSTIRNPLANPSRNTDYILKVISVDGCVAYGKISVEVSSALRIPNAFSPNGDGKNDVFKINGGIAGSRIEQFTIFNRWGQAIFAVENKSLYDIGAGWNGYYDGQPAPEGVYVYIITMILPDGTKQVYKGTVMLVR